MDIATLIIVLLLVLLVLDLLKRNNKNFKKFDGLYSEMRSVLDNLQEEQRLEKEKVKVAQAGQPKPEMPWYSVTTVRNEEDYKDPVQPDCDCGSCDQEGPLADSEDGEDDREPTIDDLYGQKIIIPFEEVIWFPCLDDAQLPVNYKVSSDLVPIIREEFCLPEDNSRLVQYEDIKEFLKKNDIQIIVTYPKLELDPASKVIVNDVEDFLDKTVDTAWHKPKTPEEMVQEKNDTLADVVTEGVKKLVRYRDGDNIIHKECGSLELYKSYIKKFGSRMASPTSFPTGEEFVEWYIAAADDLCRLTEPRNGADF